MPNKLKELLKNRAVDISISFVLGIGVFFFWLEGFPQAMSYQEQYQLFLWTGDYFSESMRLPGGLARYVGEFLTQFYYVEWLGALILAFVFVAFHAVASLCLRQALKGYAASVALIPVVLLLMMMGDECVLLSYPVALIVAMAVALILGKANWLVDLAVVPLLFWLVGPAVWLYVALRGAVLGVKKYGWLALPALYLFLVQELSYHFLLQQWSLAEALLGMNYMRFPEYDRWQIVYVPAAIAALVWVSKAIAVKETKMVLSLVLCCAICVGGWFAISNAYDKGKYELIKQDYLIRNERWNDIVANAERYTVPVNFWSESVNLALAMNHDLANRQFSFFQSGVDALLMPMMRDLTSNLPTMEAFFRLGLVNESMRYAFDLQESIPNGKKSGRLTKRIVECCIINGKYDVARKHINLLKKSLFYSEWAKDAESYLGNEAWINAHPQWGKLRQLRYKDDFLFYYGEKDKILGNLFINNTDNKMALEYFMGELLLRGDIQMFQQGLGWAQQYGGYASMPAGYQDAMRCIQAGGEVFDNRYSDYAKRMKHMMDPRMNIEEESVH